MKTHTANLNELDMVELTTDLPDRGLTSGTIGTVVLVHGEGRAYVVEFVDRSRNTIGILTVDPSQIRPLSVEEAEKRMSGEKTTAISGPRLRASKPPTSTRS